MDEAQIKLGDHYRDATSGFEGVAISRHEYLHGCTRVTLQHLKDGDMKEYTFDAPALETVDTDEQITSRKTGGQRPIPAARSGE
jgi:hypothetical protein